MARRPGMRYEMAAPTTASVDDFAEKKAAKLGVKIEASYTVGEYDILILSAQQSDGLITWLNSEGYKIPNGAGPVVESYLKQKMKWFVAKVNLKEHDKMGGGKLRPIQVAYESPKFMLPIRLGTVNADGLQDRAIRGNEELAELRLQLRTRSQTWVQVEAIRGLTEFSPRAGLSVAVGRRG